MVDNRRKFIFANDFINWRLVFFMIVICVADSNNTLKDWRMQSRNVTVDFFLENCQAFFVGKGSF